MGLRVDHTTDLTGRDALAQCSGAIRSGSLVRVVLPNGPKARIFVRVYDDDARPGILDVPESIWRRMRAASNGDLDVVTIRPLTRAERLSRKLTAKHAAAVLALLAGAFAAVIGLAPLIAPADNGDLVAAQKALATTAGWQPGEVLSKPRVDVLRRAQTSADRVAAAPDQLPGGAKVVGGVLLFLSAIAASVVAVKSADDS